MSLVSSLFVAFVAETFAATEMALGNLDLLVNILNYLCLCN